MAAIFSPVGCKAQMQAGPKPDLHNPTRRPRLATARDAEALAYLAASTRPVIAENLGRDLAYGGESRGRALASATSRR